MKMVEFNVKDGALHITLLPEAREDVEAMEDKATDSAFAEIIEWQLGNGWVWVPPEQIGALTDAPILTDDWDMDDHGDFTRVGRVYWFADYQVRSEIEELLTKGRVVFQGCD